MGANVELAKAFGASEEEILNAEKELIIEVLIKRGFYNPNNVFHHKPEFWPSEFDGYKYHIRVVKWNTKSTRVTMLHARFDAKKGWTIKTDAGIRRMAHGEKMR